MDEAVGWVGTTSTEELAVAVSPAATLDEGEGAVSPALELVEGEGAGAGAGVDPLEGPALYKGPPGGTYSFGSSL